MKHQPIRAEKIKRPSPFEAATYLDRMAPHHTRKAVADARLIDAAMRAQRPQLKEIEG